MANVGIPFCNTILRSGASINYEYTKEESPIGLFLSFESPQDNELILKTLTLANQTEDLKEIAT